MGAKQAAEESVAMNEASGTEPRSGSGTREGDDSFAALIEQSLQGLVVVQGFHIVFANTAFAEIAGYAAEELRSLSPEEVRAMIHPEDQALVWGHFRDRLERRAVPPRYQYRGIRKDGDVRWLEMLATRIEYQGKPAIQGAVVDITDRKRAEEALRIQRDLGIALSTTSDLTDALNQMLEAVLKMKGIDSGGAYLFDALTGGLNLAVHAGLSAEFIESVSHYDADAPNTQLALVGKPVYQHSSDFPPGMREPLLREGLRAMAVVPVVHEERVIAALNLASHTHDDVPITTRQVLETIAAQIGGAIVRVQSEQALQESEERYRILSELTSDYASAIRVESDGTLAVEWVTEAFTRVTGYTLDELNFPDDLVKLVHPDDLPGFHSRMKAELAGQAHGGEYRIVTKGGDVRWLRSCSRPVWDQNQSRVVRVFYAAQDITERKHLEMRVRQQEQLAAVGQLAGGVAHSFNNSLTAIMLNAQILLGKPHLPPDLAPSVKSILAESGDAAQLVRQILDFSRRSPIEMRPLDIKPLIMETAHVLEQTVPESIRLGVEMGQGEYLVNGDAARIQQVLMNLVLNARDAMPEGGELRIELEHVEVKPNDEPPVAGLGAGHWVCLTVSDTGTGIPSKVLPHIFEPFFTTKERGEGTGLGLAQVYGIVKQHGGEIGVETQYGQGTTFRTCLPACQTGWEGVEQEKTTALIPKGQGETILLIEDNEKILKASRESLESLGYRTLTAVNGREALEVFGAEGKVDLVVADLIMPEMGGKELMQELRKVTPDLKAIAITGYLAQNDLRGLEKHGFLDIVHKPFNLETLAKVVRRALDTD
jgi:PAS domain S-box-containing protein